MWITSCWSNKNQSMRSILEILCIFIICFACYYNSLHCGLVFDDISAIRDNKDLRPTTPVINVFLNDFWGTPMYKEQSHKSYRPLTVLTFRLNFIFHGLNPFGYHAINILLHAVACVLLRLVYRLLLIKCREKLKCNSFSSVIESNSSTAPVDSCAFVATLLFAVHPVHSEAITGVVGRAELLSSICYLAAFLSYISAVTNSCNVYATTTNWILLSVCYTSCLLASMLCKEQGITIAGVCAAYEIFVVQRLDPLRFWKYFINLFEEPKLSHNTRRCMITSIKRLIFLGSITAIFLVTRVYIMESKLPIFTRFDNPASASQTPIRQLTFGYLIYINFMLLLFPSNLCCDWTMGTIPLIEGYADIRNLATLCTFVSLGILVAYACFTRNRIQSRIIFVGLAWLVLPFLPASNIFFPVGFVVAERVLYMPSMGFCLMIAIGYETLLQQLHRGLRHIIQAGLICLLLTHMLKTIQRNSDWRDEYTLFMSGIHVNNRNAKLYNNVGHALENEGKYQEALLYFQQAVSIQADDIGAHINLGRTYKNLEKYAEAERAYFRAKALFPKARPGESYHTRVAPNHLNVFINLANLIAKNKTRLEEADNLYKQAISMRADYVQAYINRGDVLMKLNRTADALKVYEQALFYDNENADIYYNLGVVLLEMDESQKAQSYFDKAIELNPNHEQALLNSAILLQELGGIKARQLSRARLYKLLNTGAQNEKVYFNLGMLAMDEFNFYEAEQFFKRAIRLKPDFRSALFNLALLLADTQHELDAVPFLKQLIRHHATHTKGLILLGDIYINHLRDLDAAEICYRSILEHEPHNTQGLHNLCVVFVERKHLAKAAACLQYAHSIAPNENYIERHLKIVLSRLNNIDKLPETSLDRHLAFEDFNPHEFKAGINGVTRSHDPSNK